MWAAETQNRARALTSGVAGYPTLWNHRGQERGRGEGREGTYTTTTMRWRLSIMREKVASFPGWKMSNLYRTQSVREDRD